MRTLFGAILAAAYGVIRGRGSPKGSLDANALVVSEMCWAVNSRNAAVNSRNEAVGFGNEAVDLQNEAVEKTSVP